MQLTRKQIDYCMECGVCTGSCPISMEVPGFSPRQIIKNAMNEPEGDVLDNPGVWSCLGCSRCSDRCPVSIDFPELVRSLRAKARQRKNLPRESHHGIFQSITDLQTRDIAQNRIAWAEKEFKIRETGEYFYFTGCIPYFDVVFRYLEISAVESAKSILSILNRMGIEPVLSNDERCCGHDAFWSGSQETFEELARRNMEVIKASGAKTVIFGCPEGYVTFRDIYPEYVGELPFEIIHVSEFLARELPDSGIAFTPVEGDTVTYQDPCRLGRKAGIYDAPRELIGLVPGAALAEMPSNRENALCCGTSGWQACSNCSKTMQTRRLAEAGSTGAETLLTACDKCRIHLTCAGKGQTEKSVAVRDLYTWLARQMVPEA